MQKKEIELYTRKMISEALGINYKTLCRWVLTNKFEQPDIGSFYSKKLFNEILEKYNNLSD